MKKQNKKTINVFVATEQREWDHQEPLKEHDGVKAHWAKLSPGLLEQQRKLATVSISVTKSY